MKKKIFLFMLVLLLVTFSAMIFSSCDEKTPDGVNGTEETGGEVDAENKGDGETQTDAGVGTQTDAEGGTQPDGEGRTQTDGDAHIHAYGTPEWTWNGSTAKAKFTCADDAAHTETKKAKVTNEVIKEAKCAESGTRKCTATVDFDGKTYTDTKTEVTEATGIHNYGKDEICVVCNTPIVYTEELEFNLIKDGTEYEVYGIGTATVRQICIPETYDGLPVTKIADHAFENCTDIMSVCIPSSVTVIGDASFFACTELTSIALGDSITSIGLDAFNNCTGLTGITIPDSVTSIGEYAFYDCTELAYNSYDNADYLGNSDNPYFVLVKAKNTEITSCEINGNTRFIMTSAFYGCSGLTNIAIPNGVTSIGEKAFCGCTELMGITIPNSVTSIGESAFSGCTGLSGITIPDSVTSIGEYAFYDCTELAYNTYDNAYYLGNDDNLYLVLVKAKNTEITSCEVNGSTRFIMTSAFYGCSALTNITIPNGVTSISFYTFEGCTELVGITIPNSVTSIGYSAFFDCTGLTSINFNGTKEQWDAIYKGTWWDSGTANYTIYCTDENIAKQ